MSEISNLIDKVINNGFSQTLKVNGYKKSGRNWKKTKGNFTLITNLQASTWNTNDSGSFTINLAIFFPETDLLKNGEPENLKPGYTDCIVQERIGSLMPVERDYWWEVNSNSDFEKLGNEISKAWEEYGRKWLDEYSDYEKAKIWLLEYRKFTFWAAIFAFAQNNTEECRKLLETAINENNSENRNDLSDYLKDWGKRHNVL